MDTRFESNRNLRILNNNNFGQEIYEFWSLYAASKYDSNLSESIIEGVDRPTKGFNWLVGPLTDQLNDLSG